MVAPQFVFHADNNHSESCGEPPCLTNDSPNQYVGYFQNEFGEQWTFEYDRDAKRGSLRGGDCGWDLVHEVVDGMVPGLVLSGAEAIWLRACWAAATGTPLEDVPADLLSQLLALAQHGHGDTAATLRDLASKLSEQADQIDKDGNV